MSYTFLPYGVTPTTWVSASEIDVVTVGICVTVCAAFVPDASCGAGDWLVYVGTPTLALIVVIFFSLKKF